MKQKRGFTLVELIVAMAVSAIALSMLALIFVSVGSFLTKKQIASDLNAEISSAQSAIMQVISTAGQMSDFSNEVTTLTFTAWAETTILYYEDNSLKTNDTIIANFAQITNITFEKNINILKCNLFYGENSSFFLINLE